jgi:hypothetical protein
VPTSKCGMHFLFRPSQKHIPHLKLHLKNENKHTLRNRLYGTLQCYENLPEFRSFSPFTVYSRWCHWNFPLT